MVNYRDYSKELVDAAHSVLLETMRILGEYKDDIAVVGGWVPELLVIGSEKSHTGSIDVDLAINHLALEEIGYKTICDLLLSHGYEQGEQPFNFFRKVNIYGDKIKVEVDFLAGEYGGTGKGHRTQKTQDMSPRKARGVDLVFGHTVTTTIYGKLPGGGDDSTEIKVASIPTFIVMKAFAMNSRLKEKDAWDIYYCLRYNPGGINPIIKGFQTIKDNRLTKEAIGILAEKFASPSTVGPTHVAQFEDVTNPQDRELLQRDAYERVQYLLTNL